MYKKQVHIILAITLLFTTILSSLQIVSPAYADTSDLKVTGTILHLREGPGLTYPIITTLEEGDHLTSISRDGDWTQVKTGEHEGWVASWLTSSIKQADIAHKMIISQVDRLNIRTEPDLSAAVLGQLSSGNQATLLQETTEWAKIDWNGTIGWVSKNFITINETTPKSSPVTNDEKPSTSSTQKGTVFTVSVDVLNVRTKADLNAKKLGSVSKGQAFKVLAQDHNWIQIQYNKKSTGWVYSFYGTLSDDSPTRQPSSNSVKSEGSVKIIYNGTNLREAPSTSSEVVKRTDAGEVFPIVATTDDFYEIQIAKDKTAFVANWVVTTGDHTATTTKEKSNEVRKKGTLNGLTIVVDAGHGGNDHGTSSQRGTDEKGITLKTASLLESKLSAAGANVIMTRESDEYVALRKRVSTSHQHEADAFISLHYDANESSSVSGFTTYYQNSNQLGLAQAVHEGLGSKINIKDRGTQPGNFLVLRENRQKAVLIELGFLSNASEERIITAAKFREQAALGIYQGIMNYFNEQ
ncbi:MAG: N-acetylmuramoyl-L-alanine amidase [Lysinibacillus sp.]